MQPPLHLARAAMKRKVAALALASGLLAWTWIPAQAHALLVRSNPEANASLPTAPRFVELTFSEGVEPSFSTATLLNADGVRFDNNDANVDPTQPARVTFTLRPLPDGVYTVTWKVLSAVDGHVTSGAFAFSVGSSTPAPSTAAPSAGGGGPPPSEVIARWLLYLGAAILTGGTVFLALVWRPAVQTWEKEGQDHPIDSPPWPSLARAGAAVFLLANVIGLWSQGAQAAGGSLRVPWDPVLDRVLFTTRFGALWSARLLLGLALASLLPRARSTYAHLAALALSGLLLLDLSLGSHAATESAPALPVLGDWLHLVAASVWVGGLVYLVAGLLALRRLPSQPRHEARRRLDSALQPRRPSDRGLPRRQRNVRCRLAHRIVVWVLRHGLRPNLVEQDPDRCDHGVFWRSEIFWSSRRACSRAPPRPPGRPAW